MTAVLLALALALQTQTPPPAEPPLRQEGPSEVELSPAHDTFEDEFRNATPAARDELHAYSACVAENSPTLAAETLRRDFTSRRYRNALLQLVRNNETCFRRRAARARALRSSGLPFAGSLAEHLIARDSAPLNVRLARAATGPAPQPYSVTDRMALCVVRSVPDDVARLLATAVGSGEEEAALRALDLPVQVCARGGPRLALAPAAIRAMLATAAFRTVSGGDAGPATAQMREPSE